MSVVVLTQGVETDTGPTSFVTVTTDLLSRGIVVAYPCGEKRTLTHDQTLSAIAAIDAMTKHPDIWMNLGAARASVLVDEEGMLQVCERLGGSQQEGPRVLWTDMRKAMKNAAKTLQPAAPESAVTRSLPLESPDG